MAITITFFIILVITFSLYLKKKELYEEVKRVREAIDDTLYPITVEEQKLDFVKNKYTSLQSIYTKNLNKLKYNESRLSCYNIGVGTTDLVPYNHILKNFELTELEECLSDTKRQLKSIIKDKLACICSMDDDFVVNDRKAEAKKLINREIKLRLRCLDNEFKGAAILVDWNNINRLIERVSSTFKEINNSGSMVRTYLQKSYLRLKIRELQVGYELALLKNNIKEEVREEARMEREAKREEARIIASLQKVEQERQVMERLVAEELNKLENCSEDQKALYELHLQELSILKDRERRAVSLAQLTKAGYIYVISNIGSFGEGIVKIGMTRRADPNDRVKELGDASVPELFTVHAFAFTDNAPKLENFLHKIFSNKRVNLVNKRKEFFHVSPDEVLAQLLNYDGNYELSNLTTAATV